MSDVQHLMLFKPDFKDKNHLKGTLVFKCSFRTVLGVDTDNKNRKKLCLEIEKSAFKNQLGDESSPSIGGGQFKNDFSAGMNINVMAGNESSSKSKMEEIYLTFDDKVKAE